MAAAYGTWIFRGQNTGRTYSVDIYVSDTAGQLVRFDAGAGASANSETFLTFSEPVSLVDYAQVSGTSSTTKLRIIANGVPTTHILRYDVHLTTLNNRPALNIGFNAGTRISALQM
ncbi:MAG: hypothetical protein ACQXXF_07560 [Thermoplasmatota archaeon]|jgi:hypothetical protein